MKIIIDGESVEIPSGGTDPTGASIPTGGTTGQVLAKASDTDYDTHWVDEPQALTQAQADERYLKLSGGSGSTLSVGDLYFFNPQEISDPSLHVSFSRNGSIFTLRLAGQLETGAPVLLSGLLDPSALDDAATKGYVDNAITAAITGAVEEAY